MKHVLSRQIHHVPWRKNIDSGGLIRVVTPFHSSSRCRAVCHERPTAAHPRGIPYRDRAELLHSMAAEGCDPAQEADNVPLNVAAAIVGTADSTPLGPSPSLNPRSSLLDSSSSDEEDESKPMSKPGVFDSSPSLTHANQNQPHYGPETGSYTLLPASWSLWALWSWVTFSWLGPTLEHGYHTALEAEDLPLVPRCHGVRLLVVGMWALCTHSVPSHVKVAFRVPGCLLGPEVPSRVVSGTKTRDKAQYLAPHVSRKLEAADHFHHVVCSSNDVHLPDRVRVCGAVSYVGNTTRNVLFLASSYALEKFVAFLADSNATVADGVRLVTLLVGTQVLNVISNVCVERMRMLPSPTSCSFVTATYECRGCRVGIASAQRHCGLDLQQIGDSQLQRFQRESAHVIQCGRHACAVRLRIECCPRWLCLANLSRAVSTDK